jgi:Leucine-rich repeat (LRR) protein
MAELDVPLLSQVVATVLGNNPTIQVVTELRNVNQAMRASIDNYAQQPEQVELALRMTRNSVRNLARDPTVSDEEFQVQVNNLIDRNTHIGLRLFDITSPSRRQVVMDCLASATHLRTVDLDASEMPESFTSVLTLISAMTNGNRNLSRLGLNVNGCNINDAGARALGAINAITELGVSMNNISAEGAGAFTPNTTLQKLDISFNHIGDAGALALAPNARITDLNVGSNDIGDEAILALAANNVITKLRGAHNNISDAGAQAVGATTTMTEVDFSFNQIGDAGVLALAANTVITSLSVGFNNFGAIGDQAMEQRRHRLQAMPVRD